VTRKFAILAVVFALDAGAALRGAVFSDTFDTKTAAFALSFKGEASAYRDTATFVMPGESLAIDARGGPPGDYTATTEQGVLVQTAPRKWKWSGTVH